MISVIVPIYNGEKYLDSCVESILEQSYKDFELILVDDASTDRTGIICDAYGDKDKRIKVIHQMVNLGSVQARMTGLDNAVGEYLIFIDCDDWIDDDFFKIAVEKMECFKTDIYIYGYIEEQKDMSILRRHAIETGVYEGIALTSLKKKALYFGKFYQYGIAPALWNKFFRRDFFCDNKTEVDARLNHGDDIVYAYPLINASNKIVVDNEYRPYHYRVVKDSLCRKYDVYYFERQEQVLRILKDNLLRTEEEHNIWESQLDAYMCEYMISGITTELRENKKYSFTQAKYLCKKCARTVEQCRKINVRCTDARQCFKLFMVHINSPLIYWICSKWYSLRRLLG